MSVDSTLLQSSMGAYRQPCSRHARADCCCFWGYRAHWPSNVEESERSIRPVSCENCDAAPGGSRGRREKINAEGAGEPRAAGAELPGNSRATGGRPTAGSRRVAPRDSQAPETLPNALAIASAARLHRAKRGHPWPPCVPRLLCDPCAGFSQRPPLPPAPERSRTSTGTRSAPSESGRKSAAGTAARYSRPCQSRSCSC